MSTTAPAPFGAGHTRVLTDLGSLAVEDPDRYYEMALRLRSPDAVDAVATLAVPGGRARGLHDVGRAIAQGMPLTLVRELAVDPRWLSELAALTAVAVTARTPDLVAARGLWEWAAQAGPEPLAQRHRDLRAQVEVLLGSPTPGQAEPEALSPEVAAELQADLANPWRHDPEAASTPEWEGLLGSILGPGLDPPRVLAGPGSPFDRLSARHCRPVGASAGVAVVLTAYRPDHRLLTAVRSVIAQTWQEWTLLLVDDASGPEYAHVLEEAAGLDPRVRLLRRDANGGTYRARNTALREIADCDYLTFHDSDDWSHPRRLELSLAPMVADPRLVATTAWSQKATDHLHLTRLGYRGTSRMAAALMVRRDPVIPVLGFFDPVRKSADKEFQRRISVAFPERTVDVTEPVGIVRRGQESLSSSDHSRGWRHHSRRHYAQAYHPWHRSIRRGTASAFLDDRAAERTFWAPPRWLPTDEGPDGTEQTTRHDVVLVADFSTPDAGDRLAPALRAARRGHARVGLLHLDSPVLLTGPEPPVPGKVLGWVTSGAATWVYLDDPSDVGTVRVLDPQLLHPGPDGHAIWTTGGVELVEPTADQSPDLDTAIVSRRAESIFGAPVTWISRG